MAYLFMVLMLMAVIGQSTSSDSEFKTEGVDVKVLGQSGKIALKNAKANNAVINFDYIHELDSSGNIVGKSGQKKHSINSFATQQFTFKASGLNSTYQGIPVKHIQFSATISGPGALMTVDIYVFKAAGNITAGSETMEVKKGSLKFNINISSWTFCGGSGGDNCRKGSSTETGTQLEFGIEIKGKGSPKKKMQKRGQGSKLKTFDIGGADCTLSGMVQKDGSWQEMAGDYPKTVKVGSKTRFIFRFPKFTNEVLYDPTLDLSGTAYSGTINIKAQSGLIFMCIIGFFSQTLYLMDSY